MQRSSSKLLILLLAMAVSFSTMAAAPAENKSLSLIEARYIQGVGIVILFDSAGFNTNDLQNGTAYIHSNSYRMSCEFKDETAVIRCVIGGGLSRYVGETFRVNLAGFLFWATLPGPKALLCTDDQSVWYTVHVYQDDELVDTQEMPFESYRWLLDQVLEHPELHIILRIFDKYCGPKVIV